jgi:hypothetical protein
VLKDEKIPDYPEICFKQGAQPVHEAVSAFKIVAVAVWP